MRSVLERSRQRGSQGGGGGRGQCQQFRWENNGSESTLLPDGKTKATREQQEQMRAGLGWAWPAGRAESLAAAPAGGLGRKPLSTQLSS